MVLVLVLLMVLVLMVLIEARRTRDAAHLVAISPPPSSSTLHTISGTSQS